MFLQTINRMNSVTFLLQSLSSELWYNLLVPKKEVLKCVIMALRPLDLPGKLARANAFSKLQLNRLGIATFIGVEKFSI